MKEKISMAENKKIYDIIIVGAGASGLLTASLLSQSGMSVLVLEKNEKAGKKLLASGNGRCNFTNLDMSCEKYYCQKSWIDGILNNIGPQKVIKTFEEIGIYHRQKDGYVYPYTNQASSLLEALLRSCNKSNINIKCNNTIYDIEEEDKLFKVITASSPQMKDAYSYYSKKLILAMGGRAAPSLGGSDIAYDILKKLGHGIKKPLPALVGLKPRLDNNYIKDFMKRATGIRTRGRVGIKTSKEEIWGQTGEIQFVKDGISGIEIFQLSRIFSTSIENGEKVRLLIDFIPDMEREKLEKWFKQYGAFGIIPDKLVDLIRNINDLKRLEIDIESTFGFEKAQVTAGGVLLDEIDNKSFQSKIKNNLFILGEVRI